MGALLGVMGSVSDREADEMTRRLSHRGRRVHARRFDGLFVAAIDDEPQNRIASRGDLTIVCDVGDIDESALRSAARQKDGTAAELLLAAYDVAGPAGTESANGSYAFVIVDRRRREIAFGRDFFGSLPLFWALLPDGGLAFASEYKALLALDNLQARADRDMLQYLQCAKKLPVDRTLLADVHGVPPGGVTRLDSSGRRLDRHTFPGLAVEVDPTSEQEAARRVRNGLTEAVHHICGDADRVGVALSGGIDSIAVACVLAGLRPGKPVHTFSAGDDVDDPELVTARQVAGAIGAVHHEVITPPEAMKTELHRLVWHLEDPYARCETLQLFDIGRVAREHVDLVLSGQAADSLFGGMPRYRLLDKIRPLLQVPMMRRPFTEFFNLTQLGLPPKSPAGKVLDRAYFRGRVPPVPVIRGSAGMPEPIDLPPLGPEFVNVAMARGFQAGQSQDFPKYERSFAAWGLRYRTPFCHQDFVRTAYTISDTLKIRGGTQKYVLRRAMESVVPDGITQVPKRMQSMRQDVAFADALDAVCSTILSKEAVETRGFFRYTDIARIRRRQPGRPYFRDAAMRLWTAVCTEIWAREFLDARGKGSDV